MVFERNLELFKIIKLELNLYKAQVLTYLSNNSSVYFLATSTMENLGIFYLLKTSAESLSKVLFSAFINVHSVSLFSIVQENVHWRTSRYITEFWKLCVMIVLMGLLLNLGLYWTRNIYADFIIYDGQMFILILMFGIISGGKLFFHQIFLAVRRPDIFFRNTLYVVVITLIVIIYLYVSQLPLYLCYPIIISSSLLISFVSYMRIK